MNSHKTVRRARENAGSPGSSDFSSSQDALLILRTAFGSPKLLNIPSSSLCAEHPALVRFDELLCSGISRVTNCAISDAAWIQASLPISDGGLGIRSVVVLATSAFLASAASTLALQSAILGNDWSLLDTSVSYCFDLWCRNSKENPLEGALAHKQHFWDRAAIDEGKTVFFHGQVANFPSDIARLRFLFLVPAIG